MRRVSWIADKDLGALTNRLQWQIGRTMCSTGMTVTTTIRRERHLRNRSKQKTDKRNVVTGEQQTGWQHGLAFHKRLISLSSTLNNTVGRKQSSSNY